MKNLANENFPVAPLYGLEEVGESSKLWAVGVSDGRGREGSWGDDTESSSKNLGSSC